MFSRVYSQLKCILNKKKNRSQLRTYRHRHNTETIRYSNGDYSFLFGMFSMSIGFHYSRY